MTWIALLSIIESQQSIKGGCYESSGHRRSRQYQHLAPGFFHSRLEVEICTSEIRLAQLHSITDPAERFLGSSPAHLQMSLLLPADPIFGRIGGGPARLLPTHGRPPGHGRHGGGQSAALPLPPLVLRCLRLGDPREKKIEHQHKGSLNTSKWVDFLEPFMDIIVVRIHVRQPLWRRFPIQFRAN